MKKPSLEGLFVFGLLVVISALAYLPLVNQLGYYRDDWNLIYAGYTQGAAKFIDIYSIDRPLIGYLFSGIYQLLGNSALPYNLVAYGVRLLGAIGFIWLFRMVFPNQRQASIIAGLLFLVYPGFLQMPNGIQFQPHLLNMTLSILSIAIMVYAINVSNSYLKSGLTILSILLGLGSMFMMEYFIGLEGARFLILFYVINRQKAGNPRQKTVRALLVWLPYLTAVLGFLFWRSIIFTSDRPATNLQGMLSNIIGAPLYSLMRMSADLVKDFFEVTFQAWAVPPYQHIAAARLRDFWISTGLGLTGAAIFYLFKRFYSKKYPDDGAIPENETNWAGHAILLGGLAVLMAGLPIVFADREVSFILSFDRFSLPGSFGAAWVLTGLIYFLKNRNVRQITVSFLVLVAIMTHYNNAMGFAQHWKTTSSFWWQLSWRAPQIEPGTVIMASMPAALEEDYEIWGPVNIIYYPLPGDLTLTSEVMNPATLQGLMMGGSSARTMRTIDVKRDYSQTLILSMASPLSCLRAVNGADIELSQNETYRVLLAAEYSQLDLINTSSPPVTPPADIFGPEPEHTWCYYFEKADLARQQGDWNEAAWMGDEASRLDLRPNDWSEYLPILEGYVHTGQDDKARSLVPIIKELPYVRYRYCENLISKMEVADQAADMSEGNQFLLENLCN